MRTAILPRECAKGHVQASSRSPAFPGVCPAAVLTRLTFSSFGVLVNPLGQLSPVFTHDFAGQRPNKSFYFVLRRPKNGPRDHQVPVIETPKTPQNGQRVRSEERRVGKG